MASHFHLFGVVLARFFFPQFSIVDSKTVQRSALCRSRRELSNEYLVFTCNIWLRHSRERALYSLPSLRIQIAQVFIIVTQLCAAGLVAGVLVLFTTHPEAYKTDSMDAIVSSQLSSQLTNPHLCPEISSVSFQNIST